MNQLYAKASKRFLEGSINWNSDTIKVYLVDQSVYGPDLANDEYLSDVPSGARVAGPVTLSGKTTTGGAADANDVTFTAVTGVNIEYVLIYKDTGTESTSPLIALIDQAATLPLSPDGSDINVNWSNGTNKIFHL
jgi:hypothetical protein